MKIDAAFVVGDLRQIPTAAQAAEAIGFDAVWTSETQHEAILPLPLVAEHTQRLHFGTAIAVAFARSPTVLAHAAWDLAAQSGGRFILGLGTQVKAHIERRFGMMWEPPAPKLREMILALRAIWDCWQNGSPLNFRGQFYKLTLMTPFFNPGPIDTPQVPIFIAGVNTGLCQLAGELADGFHVHPFHTAKYLREIVLPAIEAGAAKAERTRADVQISGSVFAITDNTEREMVRAQVAFYASTPSYRPVMECHGWGEVGQRLSHLAARGKWTEMPSEITDEMLDVFAVTGSPSELPRKLLAKYSGLLDRMALYAPFVFGEHEEHWKALVSGIHTQSRDGVQATHASRADDLPSRRAQ
jgi:probable F420-dependent oxidoreductase